MNRGALLFFLLYLPAISVGTTTHRDSKKPTTQIILLEDVSLLLASSFGVTGLCHPTSDAFSTIFPKCTTAMLVTAEDVKSVTSGIAISVPAILSQDQQTEHKLRKLENDEDDQMQRWRSFYGYEDDAVDEEIYVEEPKPMWFYLLHICLTLVCTLVGAIVSGLYIGLLSIDPLLLVIKSRTSESEKERKGAIKVLALVKRRHQLIVTLLVCNCMACEAMPIFLENVVHETVAILISVFLVLMFGEILPTIFFTGPDQIQLASQWAPLVHFLMFVMYPISAPIAHILEVFGGSDEESSEGFNCGTMYNRGELATLIRIQYEERRAIRQRRKSMQQASSSATIPAEYDYNISTGDLSIVLSGPQSPPTPTSTRSLKHHRSRSAGSIDSHDVNIMEGALQLKTKTAADVFLSFHKVFCVPHDMVLDETNIFTIYASGYSRVPVYVDNDRRQVKGILLTRQLMVVKRINNSKHIDKSKNDKSKPPYLSELSLHTPHCVGPETNLSDLINLFQKGGRAVHASHMAMVCARPYVANDALMRGEPIPEDAGLLGIITLEDVLEALLQEQIYDEMDAAGRVSSRDNNGGGGSGGGEMEMDAIPEASSFHFDANSCHLGTSSYHLA